ncbi:MAG: helix-turn-helix transcriptional regulator [Bacteroidales bacterium]|nr:helix-turn-helix transcriptional regulator [Bacteroidales bacterium]MBK7172160.1 helix-turn-helix transcriptional regulator [Bacteroidales bacterium]
MNQEGKNTEGIILEAARTIFIQKGFSGARMQEIADQAGINKALLHYYFRSKDHLFEAVFAQALGSFLPVIKSVLESELPLKIKIIKFVETYIDILLANPYIPGFVIQELNTNPGRFVDKFTAMGLDPTIILRQIEKEVDLRTIRAVKADHFMVNLLAMCIFPFVAKPIVKGVLRKDESQYNVFLKERKEQIIEFVMNSLSIK